MEQGVRPPWMQPGWFEQASAWIHSELERRDIPVIGPLEQPHVRPWSTVLRVPTGDGALYFKATSSVTAHEPAVGEALARWRRDCVPELLAVDRERGWMLMRDAGERLREIIRSTRDIGRWYPVLSLYAGLQDELAGRSQELLALGLPDRRLAELPALYERLLSDTDAVGLNRPAGGLSAEHYGRLRELSERVSALCRQLAEYGIPETLHHGDFHDANVFVRDDQFVFVDWGDSCVAHPFFSLRTVLVSAEISLELEENAPALQLLCDVYLDGWTRYGSRERLQQAYDLARRLASINGALTWHRVVSALEEPLRAEYAEPVPALLAEFLDAESASSA